MIPAMKTFKNALYIIIFSFLLVLAIPASIYFRNDAGELGEQYPHIVKEESIRYEIKPSIPEYWVKLPQISKSLRGAIIVSEDWAFYQHHGIDLAQLEKALTENDKKLRGASTITQQMVKNVLLYPDRSLWRKFQELLLTFRVEKILSKDRILEIYLNSIEYGPNVYGIKHAAKYYFGKNSQALTPRESAFIAMLLPNPKSYSTSFRRKKLSPFASKQILEILKKMKLAHFISEETYNSEKVKKFSWEPAPPPLEEMSEAFIGNGSSDIGEVEGADMLREHGELVE